MNFIIYDLEATCWLGRPPGGVNEIIEIGAVKLNAYGEVLGSFNKFVKPTVNPILSSFCTQLTSITQQEVDSSAKYPRVLDQFQDWINIYDEDYILCSWGEFDQQQLRNDCHLHRLEDEWVESYINVKKQYHDIKGMNSHGGLKKTVKREGFEFTGIHHRAIADAENLAKIFAKYIDMWRY